MCQKLSDGPGVMTVMEKSVCSPKMDALAAAATDKSAKKGKKAKAKKTVQKTKSKKTAKSAAKKTAAQSPVKQDKKKKPASSFQIFNIKLPDLEIKKDPAKYRLCAPRKGKCKCQKIGDGPGILTNMAPSYCTPKKAVETASASAKPLKDKKSIKQVQKLLARAGYKVGTPDGAMGPKTKAAIKNFQGKAGMKKDGFASDALVAALNKAPAPALTRSRPAKKQKTKTARVKKKVSKTARKAPARRAPAPVSTPAPASTMQMATGGVKLSNCALRSGKCTCKTPEDGPNQWTIVGTAQCKRTLFVNLWDRPASAVDATPSTIKGVQKKLNDLGYDAGVSDGNMGLRTTTAITNFQHAVGMPVDGKITDILLQRLNDLAPNGVSMPVKDENSTALAARRKKPATTKVKKAAKAKTRPGNSPLFAPKIAKTPTPTPVYKPVPAASSMTNPLTSPLNKLFGTTSTKTSLPNSMDGYRNCALRKGKCLCQKLTDAPGMWTTMNHDLCTRRSGDSQPEKQAASAMDKGQKNVKKNVKKNARKSGKAAKQAAAKGPIKPVTVARPQMPKPKASASFLDSIAKVLTPGSGT